MAVLIDPPQWPAHGRLWSHLISDHSLAELHAFARATGVPERGFEGDHYDVPDERYQALIAAGAHPVTTRELLARLQRSGLRRPKRRGERVLVSIDLPDRRRDVVRSVLDPPRPALASTLVLRRGRDALYDDAASALPRLTGLNGPADRPGPARDLQAAAAFAASVFGPEAASLGWQRLGYVRTTRLAGAGDGVEVGVVTATGDGVTDRPPVSPPASFESVLGAALDRAALDRAALDRAALDRAALDRAALGGGLSWRTVEEVADGERPEIVPFLLLGYEGS